MHKRSRAQCVLREGLALVVTDGQTNTNKPTQKKSASEHWRWSAQCGAQRPVTHSLGHTTGTRHVRSSDLGWNQEGFEGGHVTSEPSDVKSTVIHTKLRTSSVVKVDVAGVGIKACLSCSRKV